MHGHLKVAHHDHLVVGELSPLWQLLLLSRKIQLRHLLHAKDRCRGLVFSTKSHGTDMVCWQMETLTIGQLRVLMWPVVDRTNLRLISLHLTLLILISNSLSL